MSKKLPKIYTHTAEEWREGVKNILEAQIMNWILDFTAKGEHITGDMASKVEARIFFVVMTSLTENIKAIFPPGIEAMKIEIFLDTVKDRFLDQSSEHQVELRNIAKMLSSQGDTNCRLRWKTQGPPTWHDTDKLWWGYGWKRQASYTKSYIKRNGWKCGMVMANDIKAMRQKTLNSINDAPEFTTKKIDDGWRFRQNQRSNFPRNAIPTGGNE